MSKRLFNVCDKVRVKCYNRKHDLKYTELGESHRVSTMPSLVGKTIVIVDYSDAHGLVYGVVEPNFHGLFGRKEELHIHWIEPDELEFA